jgi:uncharacterized delta-60 repeat protein
MHQTLVFLEPNPITIADNATENSNVGVSGTPPGSVLEGISITLTGLTHTSVDDLDFLLVGPFGAGDLAFMSDAGSGAVSNATFTISDVGSGPIPGTPGALSGTYLPTDLSLFEDWSNWGLSNPNPMNHPGSVGFSTFASSFGNNFGGSGADGTYTLYVHDDTTGNTGTLASWSLTVITGEAPVAQAGSASGNEDTVITGHLVATDGDGDPLTYRATTRPLHGSVVVNPDGTYSYTPDVNFSGTDSFNFDASDGFVGSTDATVNLTVSAVDDAPTFVVGPGTVVEPSPAGYHIIVRGTALQADGKILVVGDAELGTNSDLLVERFNADGSLDTTFGNGGAVITSLSTETTFGAGIAVQSDGKIVAISSTINQNLQPDSVAAVRYNADGTLDTGFGTAGIATIVAHASANAVALQSDGKIILAGSSQTIQGENFLVARFDTDGTLDPGFGQAGILTSLFGTNVSQRARAIAIQSDGKIVVTGETLDQATGRHVVGIARYNPDGSIDGGTEVTVGRSDFPNDVILDTIENVNGSPEIVLVGRTIDPSTQKNDVFLERLVPDLGAGGPIGDPGFGAAGRAQASTPVSDEGLSILELADGKYVVAGDLNTNGSDSVSALFRYNADGTPDMSFGVDGVVTTSFGDTSFANKVFELPDGKLLVVGGSGPISDRHVVIARYNPDGSLDQSFAATNTLDGAPHYTQNGAPVVIDGNVALHDAELAAAGNFAGASLTLTRHGGASADDHFGASGNLSALTEGGALVLSGVTIGAVTHDGDGTLVLTFNASATEARVDETLSSITYANAGTAPPTSVQLDWSFSDGNAGAQGGGGAKVTTGATTVSITAAGLAHPTADFNGDGHSDIQWQNLDGTPAVWLTDGTSLVSGANVGFNPGPAWHEIGSGEFNGDAHSDILWQNTDGTIAEWLLNGTSLISGASVAFNPGPSWHAIDTGDFNGDGKSDILWQNQDGTPAVWLMNGLNIQLGANVGFNPGPTWHVIGAGDFNGDGKSDILWQNNDGTVAEWLMNGTSLVSGASVAFNPGSNWHAVGTGDFNGDGKADIVWQNIDGTPAIWLMDGLNILQGQNVGFNPGPAWHALRSGDYNGDGKSDILWQNTDGTAAVWLMNGTSLISGANVGSDPGSNWHVIPQHHDLFG